MFFKIFQINFSLSLSISCTIFGFQPTACVFSDHSVLCVCFHSLCISLLLYHLFPKEGDWFTSSNIGAGHGKNNRFLFSYGINHLRISMAAAQKTLIANINMLRLIYYITNILNMLWINYPQHPADTFTKIIINTYARDFRVL